MVGSLVDVISTLLFPQDANTSRIDPERFCPPIVEVTSWDSELIPTYKDSHSSKWSTKQAFFNAKFLDTKNNREENFRGYRWF